MSTRNAFVRSVQMILVLLVFFGGIGIFLSIVYDMCKEFVRSPLGQTTLSMHSVPEKSLGSTVELPSSLIRGDYTKVLLHQEIVRGIFLHRIMDSSFPLSGVDAEFTEDGFLKDIEPVFAPLSRPSFVKEYVLVFLPGERMIEECFPRLLDACVRSTVGREFQIKRIFTNKEAIESLSPRLLVIVYGLQEYTT